MGRGWKLTLERREPVPRAPLNGGHDESLPVSAAAGSESWRLHGGCSPSWRPLVVAPALVNSLSPPLWMEGGCQSGISAKEYAGQLNMGSPSLPHPCMSIRRVMTSSWGFLAHSSDVHVVSLSLLLYMLPLSCSP